MYSYTVTMNSAENLSVTAYLEYGGAEHGSDGPHNHTASGSAVDLNVNSSLEVSEGFQLRLVGIYSNGGSAYSIETATPVEIPFIEPQLSIVSARREASDRSTVLYSYQVTLNDASSLSVTADAISILDNANMGTDGPFVHSASETTGELSLPTGYSWVTGLMLRLTGTYNRGGTDYSISAEVPVYIASVPPLIFDDSYFSGEANMSGGVKFELAARPDTSDPIREDHVFQILSLTANWYDGSDVNLSSSPLAAGAESIMTWSWDPVESMYWFDYDGPVEGRPDEAAYMIVTMKVFDLSTGQSYTASHKVAM